MPDGSLRVALLCPGPSIGGFWGEEPWGKFLDYDLVLAINTTAHRYRHHWCCGVDAHIFKKLWSLPEACWPYIGCLTNGSRGVEATKHGRQVVSPPLTGKFFLAHPYVQPPGKARQSPYTFPNALYFARLQAGRSGSVDVYGCDYTSAPNDFSGQKGDHGKIRWEREAVWIRAIWAPNITVFSDIKPSVLAFFAGQADRLVL